MARAQTNWLENKKILFPLIFMLALALRIGFYFLPRDMNTDVYYMLELADNFFSSGYRVLGEPHYRFMPFYPFLLAVAHQVLRLPYLPATRVILVLFSSLMPCLILLWPSEDRKDSISNLLAGLLMCFSGFDVIYGSQAGTDAILGFLVLAGFLLFRKKQTFLAGAVLGLAYLTRPEGQLALLVLLLVNWKKPRQLLTIGLGFLLVSSPWLIYTWKVAGVPGGSNYLTEFFTSRHSGFKFLSDLVLSIGPLALVLAVIGWLRSAREDQKLFGGFFLFYVLLHVWWWWTGARFSESLLGMVFLLSGRGILRLVEMVRGRGYKLGTAAFIIGLAVLAEQAAVGGRTGGQMLEASKDPYLKACRSLAGNQQGNVLAAFPLLAKFESGSEGVDLKAYRKGISQDQFVLEKVLKQNVHWLVWCSKGPWDVNYFPFLSRGEPRRAEVALEGKSYALSYDFYGVFRSRYYYVYIYELSARPRP